MQINTNTWVRWPGLLVMLAAWADVYPCSDDSQQSARQLLEAGDILPLEQVMAMVHHNWPGHVLEVELECKDGARYYQVEVVDPLGKVWKLHYNARTGTPAHDLQCN